MEPVSNNSGRIIVVTRATGRRGSAVYQHLLKKGCKLRTLVRDPNSNQARRLMDYGEKVLQGSLDDPNSLMRAMDGVYGIPSSSWRTGIERSARRSGTGSSSSR
jgi:uncharacterized protein YbjT (DUF2867 family)